MKKRVLWSLLVVVALLAIATPAALAYGSVTGQVNDGHGAGWTHGGTVTCIRDANGATAGTGTIGATGAWTVSPMSSSGSTVTCTIDPAAGSAGDPASFTCIVPQGGGQQQYVCAAQTLPNGPNAVSLSSFAGSRAAPAWLLAPIGLAAAVFFWVRGR